MNVEIKLFPKQKQAWTYLLDDATTEMLYGGAAGGGKSRLGCLWQIYKRIQYPGTRGLIGRETMVALKESTLKTFWEVLRIANLKEGKHWKYNASDHVVTFYNGSTIKFQDLAWIPSDPEYDRLGSTEYTDMFIDEGGQITNKCFDILQSRIRWRLTEYDLIPKILITCNPGDHWIKYRYIKDTKGNAIRLAAYQKYVPALLTDNSDKAFVKLYRQQLDRMSSDYDKQRLIHGDWDAQPHTGGEFYKSFSQKNVKEHEYDKARALFTTWDFNVHPYTVCLIAQLHRDEESNKRTLCFIDEVCMPHPQNIERAAKEVLKEYYNRLKHDQATFIDGDPSGRKEDVAKEKGHNYFYEIQKVLRPLRPQLRVQKQAPSVSRRGDFINTIFKQGYEGITIEVSPKCYNLIKDLNQVKQEAEGVKQKKKITGENGINYEPLGHCSDAMDYLICRLFRAEFELFKRGNDEFANITLGEGDRRSDAFVPAELSPPESSKDLDDLDDEFYEPNDGGW